LIEFLIFFTFSSTLLPFLGIKNLGLPNNSGFDELSVVDEVVDQARVVDGIGFILEEGEREAGRSRSSRRRREEEEEKEEEEKEKEEEEVEGGRREEGGGRSAVQ
jgi:hypothetical protein